MSHFGGRNRYIPGDYNVIDEISGQKHKRSDCRLNWKGQLVHHTNWEPKHPQLTIRGRKEKIAVEDPRTQGDPVFGEGVAADLTTVK